MKLEKIEVGKMKYNAMGDVEIGRSTLEIEGERFDDWVFEGETEKAYVFRSPRFKNPIRLAMSRTRIINGFPVIDAGFLAFIIKKAREEVQSMGK